VEAKSTVVGTVQGVSRCGKPVYLAAAKLEAWNELARKKRGRSADIMPQLSHKSLSVTRLN
jgi:hypothetical protein